MIINKQKQKTIKESKKYYNPLITDAPDLQTLRQRYSYSFITFLFWMTWFYLVLPINSLLAWMLGGQFFYQNMILLGGWTGLMEKLITYAVVILVMAVTFFGWAIYNRTRFINRERRTNIQHVTEKSLAESFQITELDVFTCRISKRLVIDFNESGRIVYLRGNYPGIGSVENNYGDQTNSLLAN